MNHIYIELIIENIIFPRWMINNVCNNNVFRMSEFTGNMVNIIFTNIETIIDKL